MEKLLEIIDGKFGKKVLISPVRKYWRIFTKALIALISISVFILFLKIWYFLVNVVNVLVWS